MKTKFILALAAALLFNFGCASSQGPSQEEEIVSAEQEKLDRVRRTAEIAALNGTYLYLLDHPEKRDTFNAAATALGTLVQEKNGDPVTLRSALAMLPVNELRSGKAAILVANVELLLEEYSGKPMDIDTPPRVRALTQGVHAGITKAVEMLVPPN